MLTATILLVAEFCEPQKRHIVSVFKIIQELLAPSNKKGKNQFQQLMELLPNDHKAKWFAGAALNTAEQSMASVMSTALSRLNSFLDSELEQLLCFDTEIDAESFCNEKSAIFIIMPEENPNTFFMISLIIQQLYREILAVADENGGKLKNRCVFYCDEFGTLPKIESAEMMFSASRSRRLQIVPIIQSFSQLDKNYRLDYGKKYCHDSPSIEESVLQEAIMKAVLQTAKQNADVLKTLKLHIGMGLSAETTEDNSLDLQIRIAEVEAEFQKMLKAIAADNVEAFDEEKAKALMDEKAKLQIQLDRIADTKQKRENAKSRLDEIFTIIEALANHPISYDDQIVRQVLESVIVESKEKIKVVFVGGLEVTQLM